MAQDIATLDADLDETTKNYAVYEADGMVGAYVALAAFDGDPPEALQFGVTEDGDVTIQKDKDTKNYGRYASEGNAINGMYLSHDLIGSEETDDGHVAPETLGIRLDVDVSDSEEDSDEEQIDEEEVEALAVAGGGDESDDSDEEEVEISDEELDLPGDD